MSITLGGNDPVHAIVLVDPSTGLPWVPQGIQSVDDGALTIAKTNGLQDALDAKAPLANPVFTGSIKIPAYTVATLPTGAVGKIAYVTDATTPTYLGELTGGGAVVCPVFYNGTAWVSF